jgi:hypothetical protein
MQTLTSEKVMPHRVASSNIVQKLFGVYRFMGAVKLSRDGIALAEWGRPGSLTYYRKQRCRGGIIPTFYLPAAPMLTSRRLQSDTQ